MHKLIRNYEPAEKRVRSDAIDYIGYILGTRDKTLDYAAGGDMKSQALLHSLHKKIAFNMNT
jgi:hypothetical protein